MVGQAMHVAAPSSDYRVWWSVSVQLSVAARVTCHGHVAPLQCLSSLQCKYNTFCSICANQKE